MDVAYNYSRKEGPWPTSTDINVGLLSVLFWSKEMLFRMLGRPHVTACHLGKLSHCSQKTALLSLGFYFYTPFHSSWCSTTFHTVDFFFSIFSFNCEANSIWLVIIVIHASTVSYPSQFGSPKRNLWLWCCFNFTFLNKERSFEGIIL